MISFLLTNMSFNMYTNSLSTTYFLVTNTFIHIQNIYSFTFRVKLFIFQSSEVKRTPQDQRKKSYIPIHQKSSVVFPKNLALYWAEKKEQEQENKFGFHGFQYKGAVNYQHNYWTQTLSSNSWNAAGTSHVKHKSYNEKSSSNGFDK